MRATVRVGRDGTVTGVWRSVRANIARMAEGQDLADERRLLAVRRIRALSRIGDAELERIVRVAVAITGTANGAVHILDDHLQHRIAAVGGAPLETWPVDDSMCRLVVESGEAIATADATKEPMFSYSSYVEGEEPEVEEFLAVGCPCTEGVRRTVAGRFAEDNREALPVEDTHAAAVPELPSP